MSKIELICDWCSKPFLKEKGEISRKLKNGKNNFFCSLSCGAKWNNEVRDTKSKKIIMTCKCGKEFETSTKRKAKRHCSNSCASKYSVTEKRRSGNKKGGILSSSLQHMELLASKSLKSREGWKYKKLIEFLNFQKEKFEFEKLLGKFVFDLALIKRMILVEFDGKYHRSLSQIKIDIKKDKLAKDNGWTIFRVNVKENSIIDPDVLYPILNKFHAPGSRCAE